MQTHTPPRLGFVGPMLGQNPGWVTSQGEILAQLFSEAGYTVRLTSRIPERLPRLADTLRTLFGWRREVDVLIHMVFSGTSFAVTDAASLLGRRLGLPQLFVLHGGNLPRFAARYPGWTARVLGRAERLAAPSGYLAHAMQSRGHTVRVIPNVLALAQYPYRPRAALRPRLLWMRTFHPVYHPELAVETLARVAASHPEARLTMAGQDKGQLAATRALAAAHGLQERVRFAGFLDLAGKQREFAQHDIFLNTNRVDNMPVSVLEAAAFGLPVVATAVGGIPFLLTHAETGLLVAPEDAAAMATAVTRLLHDPELAARLGRNGRLLAESCAWERVKSQWEALFAELRSERQNG
jgi:L-malate glycosyltransferase